MSDSCNEAASLRGDLEGAEATIARMREITAHEVARRREAEDARHVERAVLVALLVCAVVALLVGS
jgi:hypothetical protein